MDPEVMLFADTVLCADISTPVIGQMALNLMVDPLKPGDPSWDTYTQVTHLQVATFPGLLVSNPGLGRLRWKYNMLQLPYLNVIF